MGPEQTEARTVKANARDRRALLHNPVTLGIATAHLRDPVCIRDVDGCFVFVNDAAVRAFGRTQAEEIVGKRLGDLVDAADARAVEEDDRKVIETGFSSTETRTSGVGAARRSWRITKLALRNRRGRVIGVLSLSTELFGTAPEHLLQSQQQTLKLALGASQLHIWGFEFARRRVEASDALCAIFGLDPARCARLGPWRRLVDQADRDAVERAFRNSVKSGGLDVEFRIRRTDGVVRWVHVQAIVVEDAGKYWMHGVAADVTERRAQAEALIERNERLKFALDAAHMSFWTIDANTREMTVGPDFRGIVALEPGTPVTTHVLDRHILGGDRRRVRALIRDALSGDRASFDIDFRVPNRDGSIRWVNAQGMTVIRENRPRRVIGVVSDVTGRIGAQAEREQLLAREQEARTVAEAAARARDQFLAIVSHELRSPLSGIQSWTHVLESQIGKDAPHPVRRAITGVRTGVEQQVRLIDDLLDATRIMSGKLSLVKEPAPFLPIVEAAVASVREQARGKRIEILTDYQAETEQVMGDRDRLQQIVWNLLSNAVKFTPDDGHVWVRLMRQGESVRLTVRDDGKGIPPEFQDVMFEWFRRQETSSHRGQDGLGLGLALVRHLCHLHGGSVTASSAGAGKGSTFVVTLPVLPSSGADTAGRSVRRTSSVALPSLAGLRVLLVDDQSDARESLAFVLREAGAELVSCGSAKEALEAIDRLGVERAPSVLVSDIAMPAHDGYWLLARIRERESATPGARLPAIALTAYAQPEDRLRSLTSGFDMHVTKPVSADELIVIVATVAGHIIQRPG